MAPRIPFEDLVEQIREAGLDEVASTLDREYSATSLRKEAGRARELEVELEKTKSQLEELVMLPKKEKLFADLGVDMDALRPAERDLLRTLKPESGDPDESWAEKIIERYQLPTGAPIEPPEETGAAQIAGQARQAPAGGKSRSGVITPEDVAAMSVEKRQAFKKNNPDAWERLLDGEEVSGISL